MHPTTDPHKSARASDAAPAVIGSFGEITPTADESWLIRDEGFRPDREHDIESIFAVANGRFGVRGSLAEGMPLSAPATYAAGFYTHPKTGPQAEPAVLPNWTLLRAQSDGVAVSLTAGRILRHVRTLDMRQGLLWREWLHEDPHGRVVWILGVRGASLADRRLLFQGCILQSHNFAGPLLVEAGVERNPLDGAASVEVIPAPETGHSFLVARYNPERLVAAAGDWACLFPAAGPPLPSKWISSATGYLRQWSLTAGVGESVRLERISAFAVADDGIAPTDEVKHALEAARETGFQSVVAAHAAAWRQRWDDADIEIDGDELSQRRLRFAMYHLLSAAPAAGDVVGIGARALTGRGYLGHVFWDTEIFVLPFYLMAAPGAAKALLMYRYRTLDKARLRARDSGYAGALYAWESADTGEDATPEFYLSPTGEFIPIFSGAQEHHISADVAWAVARYWQSSVDLEFFLSYGAEIIFETARFWASRSEHGADGRYHIRRIMGPDEYHHGVNDNAYTNQMARWNLRYAAGTADWMAQNHPKAWRALQERLALSIVEMHEWRQRADAMADGFDPITSLIEQFDGYFSLAAKIKDEELRLAPTLGGEYQGALLKQADVVLLFQLFPGRFPDSVVAANFDYYSPRTVHGSSLSPSTYALVAARLGRLAQARQLYDRGGEIDLASQAGNASGGVHIAAMGGLWQATLLGFAGMEFFSGGIELRPHLPPDWKRLAFHARWRGRRIALSLTEGGRTLEAELLEGEDMTLRLEDQEANLRWQGGPRSVRLRSSASVVGTGEPP